MWESPVHANLSWNTLSSVLAALQSGSSQRVLLKLGESSVQSLKQIKGEKRRKKQKHKTAENPSSGPEVRRKHRFHLINSAIKGTDAALISKFKAFHRRAHL